MTVYTETEANHRLNGKRRSVIVPTRRWGWGKIYDRRIINVGLNNDWSIVTHDRIRPMRVIAIVRIFSRFVMAIVVSAPASIALPTTCQRYPSANKDHKRCNSKYFQKVGFHGGLLFSFILKG
jgi:hypothetical protein